MIYCKITINKINFFEQFGPVKMGSSARTGPHTKWWMNAKGGGLILVTQWKQAVKNISIVIWYLQLGIISKRVKKNQLDAQLILSIFRQTLHVSGVYRSVIMRYNRMYTTVGTCCSFAWLSVVVVGLELNSKPTTKTDSHLKRIISTSCCLYRLYVLMMGPDTPETCRGWRNI
jgi:hypothetical protein